MRYQIIQTRRSSYYLVENIPHNKSRVSPWYESLLELINNFQRVSDPLLVREYNELNGDTIIGEADTIRDLLLQFPWAVL